MIQKTHSWLLERGNKGYINNRMKNDTICKNFGFKSRKKVETGLIGRGTGTVKQEQWNSGTDNLTTWKTL